MKIKSQKDFFAGLMFLVVGGLFAIGATRYNVGSAARMGPGYFPLLLGILLAFLGACIIFHSLAHNPAHDANGDKIGKWAWRPIAFVLGANLAFGVLLGGLPSIGFPSFGLIAAIYALTFIASHAGGEFKLRDVVILATILAVGSYLAFIVLLKLQIPVWPAFLMS
ncbi:MAG: tripartite tricarboxylate transporter TctB family protein [Cytophagales bacterium]|nr:tripartite tricarboxylate transporter TctB family protein [Cytophagales bacterium]